MGRSIGVMIGVDIRMKWQDERALNITQLTALARKAIVSSPDRPLVWLALGREFQRLGYLQEAVDILEKAVARMPTAVPLRITLAEAGLAVGEFETALEHVGAALRLEPENRDARVLHFTLLCQTAQWDRVERLVDGIAQISPLEPYLYEVWGRKAGKPEDIHYLLDRCEAALAGGFVCANAVYFKALALAKLGRVKEARNTISTERFVEVCDLPIPDGFATADSFRKTLAKEILVNPTLVPDPRGKATRGGRQTRELRHPDAPAVESLIRQIKTAIDVYDEGLSSQSGGLAFVRPTMARLRAWAVVYGAEGQQTPHRHSVGWVSGVYYVSATRPPRERTYRGSLLLGVLPTRHGITPPWGTREIEPVPGRLVIFPSYVPHATKATGIDGARISVAFDIIPVG